MTEEQKAVPGWQTQELEDEWPDSSPEDELSDDDDAHNLTYGTRSISLTAPLPSSIQTNDIENDNDNSQSPPFHAVGTFLVREDVPKVPMLPKTPGRGRAGIMKDFFSPLPLERMFEPPTPPIASTPVPPATVTSTPSDEILETDLPDMVAFHGRKANMDCKFTFAAPKSSSLAPTPVPRSKLSSPQAQSTPVPAVPASNAIAPLTDPRLRLFQFQYDTFTRDHLSALADSIAVNTPSGTTTGTRSERRLSPVSEASFSDLRSTKRVKLSPFSDYGEGDGARATIARPKIYGKAYVGESQSLMEKIKQARDFSTISTVVSGRESSPANDGDQPPDLLNVPALSEDQTSTYKSTSSAPYSSSTYRQQAAALMAQIKSDVKGTKRVFSGDSATSVWTPAPVDKENLRESTRHRKAHSNTSPRRSPRKARISGPPLDEVTSEFSRLDIAKNHPTSAFVPPHGVNIIANPALLIPARPSTTTNDDLKRYVSSSTASGTTLTTASVPSYVKHPGPAHLRTIAPQDVPVLPDRMGDMLFDKVMMRWVKNVQAEVGGEIDQVSEDPFGDIESLRDDSLLARVEEEPTDDEEMALTSFSTDASGRIVSVMTGVETEEFEETTDSEAENDAVITGSGSLEHVVPPDLDDTDSELEADNDTVLAPHHVPVDESLTEAFAPPPIVVTTFETPIPPRVLPPVSALKKTPATATPSSAMKDAARSKFRTPKRTHRRSVSFSDGKREGPIVGLSSAEPQPSARSKRIAEMLAARSDSSELESDAPTHEPASPSLAGSTSSRRVFSRSHVTRDNGTFLTECSFGVAHDQLVQVLTDVEPFEPHWETLATVELSGKRLESVARLKEFLPALDALNLNSNQLAWLSGVPSAVRTLSVASNRLTGLTSYSHLLNLENLDISRNEVDSLRQLSCLRHLRELRADGNTISDVDGLQNLDGLVKLSLAGNRIAGELNFSRINWTRLEVLDLSDNQITTLGALHALSSLVVLNVDDNRLKGELDAGGLMTRVRVVRASGNKLEGLKVNRWPGVRTLYIDGNALDGLDSGIASQTGTVGRAAGKAVETGGLNHLENLSLRNQSKTGALKLNLGVFRDAKRLYLSGNVLSSHFFSCACYNLVYLELANCRLRSLPTGIASLVPNVRALNLNYNFLEDVRGLEGLSRLRKLSVVGARLKSTKEILRSIQGMSEIEALDFRMNPCTLGWYLPLIVKSEMSAAEWAEMDGRFRRGLPDGIYVGRLAYRGLIMRACPGIRVLDGVAVTSRERSKTEGVLKLMGR
ncbi:unnamed protein product [Mycena citricolor]|uniref:L domain-like protein n=1 Tax=Mycena citricolor TaxID=2018698 RepID=A0AAD2HYS3_9AGAR|nr:unnamed protein product [Mycena citricolor]